MPTVTAHSVARITQVEWARAAAWCLQARRARVVAQVAINWAMCKGCIPIPGVTTRAMAEDNLGAAGWRLAGGEEAALDAAAAAVERPMLQNVFQTA